MYDLIICNPPYFSSSMRPQGKERSLARHDDGLSLEELFKGAAAFLLPTGKLSLIIPAELREKTREIAAKHTMFPVRVLHIQPTPEKEAKRVCLEYSFKADECTEETLVIEEGGRHVYSEAYTGLTKDFYL